MLTKLSVASLIATSVVLGSPLPKVKRVAITQSTNNPGSGSIIDLKSAAGFTIFSKTGISNIPGTANQIITGSIGVAPIAITAVTGFALADQGGYSTSQYVTGKVTGPSSAVSTTSVPTDIVNAYTTGMNFPADVSELNAGSLDGLTLAPGVYKWTTAVVLGAGKTLILNGACGEVFVLQSTGAFSTGANSQISLIGGVTAATIYWIGATSVTTGVASDFSGIIMTYTNVVIAGSLTGRALVQTQIALHMATITSPTLGTSKVKAIPGYCSLICAAGSDSSSGSCVVIIDGLHYSDGTSAAKACTLGLYGASCDPITGNLLTCIQNTSRNGVTCTPTLSYAHFEHRDIWGSDYSNYLTVDSEYACATQCASTYNDGTLVGSTYYDVRRSSDSKNCFCKNRDTYSSTGGLMDFESVGASVSHVSLRGHCSDFKSTVQGFAAARCVDVFFSTSGAILNTATGLPIATICPDTNAATCDANGNTLSCIQSTFLINAAGLCISAQYARFTGRDVIASDIPSYFHIASESLCASTCATHALSNPGVPSGFGYYPNRSSNNCFCKGPAAFSNGLTSESEVSFASLIGACTTFTSIPGRNEAACVNVSYLTGSCIVVSTQLACPVTDAGSV